MSATNFCSKCRRAPRKPRRTICKHCAYVAMRAYTMKWRKKNAKRYAEITTAATLRYRARHAERVKAAARLYYAKNKARWPRSIARKVAREPERVRADRRRWAKRRRNSLAGKLAHSHRVCVRRIFKRIPGGPSSMRLLGCSPEYLRVYISAMLRGEMTAENYGTVWHLDHIKPLSAFDLTKRAERKACFHFSNLQPLTWQENLAKGDKWDPRNDGEVVARRERCVDEYRAFCRRQKQKKS